MEKLLSEIYLLPENTSVPNILYRKEIRDAIGKRTEKPRIKKVKKGKRKQREVFTGERVPAVSIKEESMESDIVYNMIIYTIR